MMDNNLNGKFEEIKNMLNIDIANNQLNHEFLAIDSVLKSNPCFIKCPSCHSLCVTRTVKRLSFKNTLFCLLCSCLWFPIQILKNKDLNCYDTKHYCLNCNTNIKNYYSC